MITFDQFVGGGPLPIEEEPVTITCAENHVLVALKTGTIAAYPIPTGADPPQLGRKGTRGSLLGEPGRLICALPPCRVWLSGRSPRCLLTRVFSGGQLSAVHRAAQPGTQYGRDPVSRVETGQWPRGCIWGGGPPCSARDGRELPSGLLVSLYREYRSGDSRHHLCVPGGAQ